MIDGWDSPEPHRERHLTGAGPRPTPSPPTPVDDPAWPAALDDVLAGEGLETVFQPIVDLARGVVTGYEALSRFHHPDVAGGPDRWFAAATRAGRAAALDARAVCSALVHRPALPGGSFLSVNVEPASLQTDAVGAAFASSGSLVGVVVEITEHRPLDPVALEPALDRLRGDGALIAVDDTGAGHAGLAQILHLRPSIVKLDRSIVHGIDRDEAKAALVEMLGIFAGRVDASLLAEGIETEDELLRLAALGVPLGQGWALGRPAAPWAPLEPAAAAVLVSRPASDEALRPLMTSAPTGRQDGTDLAELLGDDGHPWVVALDDGGRPRGVLTAEAAMTGEMLPALRVNVHSTPGEVAHRLSTAATDPTTPAVVVDDAGRYLGIVTLRRLLAELARDAAPSATGVVPATP